MKLGYYYQVTANGASSKELTINGGDWCSVVDDERKLWTKYAVANESLALTFVNNGVVITVVKILGGSRPDNNVATWIFVPTKILISGTELQDIINEIKLLYQTGTKMVTEDSFLGNTVLGKDYSEKRFVSTIHKATGSKLAYRLTTGDYTQKEILDSPFQDYYGKYKYIFLFNQIPSDIEGLQDLSRMDIKDIVTVLHPSVETIHEHFGNGDVTINLDGSPFNHPVSRVKKSVLNLTAERKGFVPRQFIGQVVEDEKEAQYTLTDDKWKKILTGQEINVKDRDSEHNILSPKFTILNCQWDKLTSSLPEDCLSSVKVRIEAAGYQTTEKDLDLSNSVPTVYLEKQVEKAEYTYHTKDGRQLEITITGKGATSNYPLDGYVKTKEKELKYKEPIVLNTNNCSGHPDRIKHPNKHDRRFAWKEFCYGIISIVLLALVVFGGYKLYRWSIPVRNSNDKELTINQNNSSTDSVVAKDNDFNDNSDDRQTALNDLNAAVGYLDSHEVWEKSEMEKYPDLKGLFDDLNNMETHELCFGWQNKLKDSKSFQEVAQIAKKNRDRGWNPKQYPRNPTFNKPGDDKINLINYKNWLDRDQTPKPDKATTHASGRKRVENHDKTKVTPKKETIKFDKHLN